MMMRSPLAASSFFFALSLFLASSPHCGVHAQQQEAPKASEILESPVFTRCDNDESRQAKCLEKVSKREMSVMKMDSSTESDEMTKKLRDIIGLVASCWSCLSNRAVKAQICYAIDYGANLLYNTYKVPVQIPYECVQEFMPSPTPSAIAVDGNGATNGGDDLGIGAQFFLPLLPIIIGAPVFKPVIKPYLPEIDCPGGSEGHICSSTLCTCDNGLRCVELDNLSCGGAFLKLVPPYPAMSIIGLAPGVCKRTKPKIDASTSNVIPKFNELRKNHKGIFDKAHDYAEYKLKRGARVNGINKASDIKNDPEFNSLQNFFDDFQQEEVNDYLPDDGVTFYFGMSTEAGLGVKGSVSEGIFFDTKGKWGAFICRCGGVGYNFGGGVDAFLGVQLGLDSIGGYSTDIDFDVDLYAGVGIAMGQTCDNKGVLNIEISVGAGAGANVGSLSVCKCETYN